VGPRAGLDRCRKTRPAGLRFPDRRSLTVPMHVGLNYRVLCTLRRTKLFSLNCSLKFDEVPSIKISQTQRSGIFVVPVIVMYTDVE
jgi:hypothetical protein